LDELKSELRGIFDDFIWAPGHIVWDDPESIRQQGATSKMAEGLYKRLDRLENELLAVKVRPTAGVRGT
jgi:hypothetical protein